MMFQEQNLSTTKMETENRQLSKRWTLAFSLLAIYLPQSWLLFMDYPWDAYRWSWIKIWLLIPGIVLSFFMRGLAQGTWLQEWIDAKRWLAISVLSVIFVVLVVGGLFWARRYRVFRPMLAFVSILCCFFGWVANGLMRF